MDLLILLLVLIPYTVVSYNVDKKEQVVVAIPKGSNPSMYEDTEAFLTLFKCVWKGTY